MTIKYCKNTALRLLLLVSVLSTVSLPGTAQSRLNTIAYELDSLKNSLSLNSEKDLGSTREIYYRYINHDVDSAITYANRSLVISRELSNAKYEAYSLADLSHAYLLSGDFGKALNHILRSVELSSTLGSEVYAYSLFYLAQVYNELYLPEIATDYFKQSELLFDRDRNKWLSVFEHLNIQVSRNDTSDLTNELTNLQNMLPSLDGEEYKGFLYHYLALSLLFSESGFPEKALFILDTIKTDVLEYGSNYYTGLLYYNYAQIAHDNNDTETAILQGENALEYFTRQKGYQWKTRTHYFLADLYRSLGDIDKAYTELYAFEQSNRKIVEARQLTTGSRLLTTSSQKDVTESQLLETENTLRQRQLYLLTVIFLLAIVFTLLSFAYRSNLAKRKALKRLDALNREKNAVIGIVSHDLKSPLNSVMMLSDLLTGRYRELQHDEIREYSGLIFQASRRMEYLIDNLLDASKIESGDTRLSLRPVDVRKTIEFVYNSVKMLGKEKGITTHLYIDDTIPEVMAEPNALIRVMENLLSNAYKFSEKGSSVSVTVRHIKNSVEIAVQDQGPGISEEDQAHLFKKFSRLSSTPTSNEKTSGLGLFIVKNLVDEMKGQISVDSEPGKGSTFRVVLNTV